jgi:hypothetical protein
MELASVIVSCWYSTTIHVTDLMWIFPSLFTAGTMTGFDASGHVAEETKNAQ